MKKYFLVCFECHAGIFLNFPTILKAQDVLFIRETRDWLTTAVVYPTFSIDLDDLLKLGLFERCPMEVYNLAKGVGNAIAYMHDMGFWHRDIKPKNIGYFVLDSQNIVPKVFDFDHGKNSEKNNSIWYGTLGRMPREWQVAFDTGNALSLKESYRIDIWQYSLIMAEVMMDKNYFIFTMNQAFPSQNFGELITLNMLNNKYRNTDILHFIKKALCVKQSMRFGSVRATQGNLLEILERYNFEVESREHRDMKEQILLSNRVPQLPLPPPPKYKASIFDNYSVLEKGCTTRIPANIIDPIENVYIMEDIVLNRTEIFREVNLDAEFFGQDNLKIQIKPLKIENILTSEFTLRIGLRINDTTASIDLNAKWERDGSDNRTLTGIKELVGDNIMVRESRDIIIRLCPWKSITGISPERHYYLRGQLKVNEEKILNQIGFHIFVKVFGDEGRIWKLHLNIAEMELIGPKNKLLSFKKSKRNGMCKYSIDFTKYDICMNQNLTMAKISSRLCRLIGISPRSAYFKVCEKKQQSVPPFQDRDDNIM